MKYRFRVQTLGEEGSGKLSLVERVERDYFRGYEKPPSRLGLEIHLKKFTVNDNEIELEIWSNHYLAKTFFPSTLGRRSFFGHGFVLVYDITDEESLQKLERWIEPCRKKIEELNTQMVFAGCKVDLEEQRTVSKEDALEFAKRLDLQIDDVIECSAKTGENVLEVFSVLASRLLSCFGD